MFSHIYYKGYLHFSFLKLTSHFSILFLFVLFYKLSCTLLRKKGRV